MAKTANDVITEALRSLNYIATDAEANADDYARALSIYKSQHAALISRLRDKYQIKNNWNFNNVSDDHFDFVAMILAGKIAGGRFRVPATIKAEAVDRGEEAESDLGQLLARGKRFAKRFPDMPHNVNRLRSDYGFNS
jgi:lysyl-tRNA synthetase class I